MIRFYSYLKAQTLRTAKLYPAILCFTLILTIGLGVILFGLFGESDNEESKQKIQIGIVGDTSDSYLGIGIEAVKNFDTSKYYIDFITLSEEEAKKRLNNSELMGYLLIPDGFVNSIVSGENKKITYVSANSPAVLGPIIMNEVAVTISDIVTESQSGIYGFMNLADKAGLSAKNINKLTDMLNIEYINAILTREKSYNTEYIGVSSGLAFKDYYFCVFIVLIFLLSGTVCAHLLIKSDLSLQRLLYCRGQNLFSQLIADYLPYFFMLTINCILIFTSAGVFLKDIPSFDGIFGEFTDISECLLFALKLIPVIALITALQFFLYELASNIISGVLLQVVTSLMLSYISGFFYPLYSLPEILQKISVFLPTGVAFNYVKALIRDELTIGCAFLCLVYFALFLILSLAVRNIRLRRAGHA